MHSLKVVEWRWTEMAIDSARAALLEEVSDAYDAEHQFLAAMEEMHSKAEDAELKDGIEQHIAQTGDHLRWLEEAFTKLGTTPERKACQGAMGIVREGQESVSDAEEGPIRDSIISVGLAKSEHYEIATYRTLVTEARTTGDTGAQQIFERILHQEEQVAGRLERSVPKLLRRAARR
jgi:ferritin-like metal-binding protein YciE